MATIGPHRLPLSPNAHRVVVLSLNSAIEEEVVIGIGDLRLVVFAAICSRRILIGNSYPVELYGFVVDEAPLTILEAPRELFEHLGQYRYRLSGQFADGQLKIAGVRVDVEDCLDDIPGNGSWVAVEVDRLSADFG